MRNIPLSSKFEGLQARFFKNEVRKNKDEVREHVQLLFTNPLLQHIRVHNSHGEQCPRLDSFLFFTSVFKGSKSLGVCKLAERFNIARVDEAWRYLEDLFDEIQTWLMENKIR